MEVKYRALENITAAGMKTTLQVSVVNGVNNACSSRDGLLQGKLVRGLLLRQKISNDERYMRRYPVSQIAYDLEAQTSIRWQPRTLPAER